MRTPPPTHKNSKLTSASASTTRVRFSWSSGPNSAGARLLVVAEKRLVNDSPEAYASELVGTVRAVTSRSSALMVGTMPREARKLLLHGWRFCPYLVVGWWWWWRRMSFAIHTAHVFLPSLFFFLLSVSVQSSPPPLSSAGKARNRAGLGKGSSSSSSSSSSSPSQPKAKAKAKASLQSARVPLLQQEQHDYNHNGNGNEQDNKSPAARSNSNSNSNKRRERRRAAAAAADDDDDDDDEDMLTVDPLATTSEGSSGHHQQQQQERQTSPSSELPPPPSYSSGATESGGASEEPPQYEESTWFNPRPVDADISHYLKDVRALREREVERGRERGRERERVCVCYVVGIVRGMKAVLRGVRARVCVQTHSCVSLLGVSPSVSLPWCLSIGVSPLVFLLPTGWHWPVPATGAQRHPTPSRVCVVVDIINIGTWRSANAREHRGVTCTHDPSHCRDPKGTARVRARAAVVSMGRVCARVYAS